MKEIKEGICEGSLFYLSLGVVLFYFLKTNDCFWECP